MLVWISDEKLSDEINTLLKRAQNAWEKAEERRIHNVIDPFQSLVIASVFDIRKRDELSYTQRVESAIRGLSNAIGNFHQQILGSVDGWENHDAGYDLECSTCRIVAEVKNKWNTMNAPNRYQVETDPKDGCPAEIRKLDRIFGSGDSQASTALPKTTL